MLAWSFLEAKAKSRTIISSHYLIKSETLFSPLFPHNENKSPSTHYPAPPPSLEKLPKGGWLEFIPAASTQTEAVILIQMWSCSHTHMTTVFNPITANVLSNRPIPLFLLPIAFHF